ncbi:MAG: response regulator transcription factor [Paracoccaceae bacterium]|nr:response regulator transcription factor [Paracoccaceae bacterium]
MSELYRHKSKTHDAIKSAVLCIEDDPIVQLMLDDIVGVAGADCFVVGTAREAEEHLSNSTYDLVLLDRQLPDSDGLLLIQSIKETSDCPIIVLSSMNETRDKLLGIGLGASEYVTKPFNPLELSTRIRQLLHANSSLNAGIDKRVFKRAGIQFDPGTRSLKFGGGDRVFLAPAEARLLHILMLNEGEVQTRDQLSQFACGREWSPGDRTIDVLINRLRRHIQATFAEIVTVHRTGYLLIITQD